MTKKAPVQGPRNVLPSLGVSALDRRFAGPVPETGCFGESVEGKEGVGGVEEAQPGLQVCPSSEADSPCTLNKPLMPQGFSVHIYSMASVGGSGELD